VYGSAGNLGTTGFSETGLVNSDTISGVTLTSAGAAPTAGVGTYALTASNAIGTGLDNYAITYAPGDLSVERLVPVAAAFASGVDREAINAQPSAGDSFLLQQEPADGDTETPADPRYASDFTCAPAPSPAGSPVRCRPRQGSP
jgi:hypothetical protein